VPFLFVKKGVGAFATLFLLNYTVYSRLKKSKFTNYYFEYWSTHWSFREGGIFFALFSKKVSKSRL